MTDETTKPQLTIRLFGPMEVLVGGQLLPRPATQKVRWLLALLALRHGRPVERRWLAGRLWPKHPESNALENLRAYLLDLRKYLGSEATCISAPNNETLCLRMPDGEPDVTAFDTAIRSHDVAQMEQAVDLHRHPLLEDCSEEWALEERRQRVECYVLALEQLAKRARDRGNDDAAVHYLRRIIEVEPLRDDVVHDLMMTLRGLDRRAEALDIFRSFERMLCAEGLPEPEERTCQLATTIRLETRRSRTSRPVTQSASARSRTHLPNLSDTLIGREAESRKIQLRLAEPGRRIVTVTGAPGIGKTRLAVAVAEALADDYPDGVWFVNLAPCNDSSKVPDIVAKSLRLPDPTNGDRIDQLRDHLRSRVTLLLFDNCEYLMPDIAGLVQTLVQGCRELQILATSRQALGISGEQVILVPPLTYPYPARFAREAEPEVAALNYESVQFFVERARERADDFVLTRANAPDVANLCFRLSGIPLALKLAAARVRDFSPGEIAERLDNRFRFLTSSDPTAPKHQRSLRAAIDWSYDLLGGPERLLLQRLSVFEGGWTADMAETICSGDGIDDVVEAHAHLVDHSLIEIRVQDDDTKRFFLLETIREYASERFRDAGDGDAVRLRHADWFQYFAEVAKSEMHGEKQRHWLARLEIEHDNLRTALNWYLQSPEGGDKCVRLAGALWWFWFTRGYLAEGLDLLRKALAHGVNAWLPVRSRALEGAGIFALNLGDPDTGRRWLEAALEAAQISERTREEASILDALGAMARDRGDYEEALSRHAQSLALFRDRGDRRGVGITQINLGSVAYSQGDYASARSEFKPGVALLREERDWRNVGVGLCNLGLNAIGLNDPIEARTSLQAALTLFQELGDRYGVADTLDGFAVFAASEHQDVRATWLDSAAVAVRKEIGARRSPLEEARQRQAMLSVQERLGEAAFSAAAREGARLTLEQAIEVALAFEVDDEQPNKTSEISV